MIRPGGEPGTPKKAFDHFEAGSSTHHYTARSAREVSSEMPASP